MLCSCVGALHPRGTAYVGAPRILQRRCGRWGRRRGCPLAICRGRHVHARSASSRAYSGSTGDGCRRTAKLRPDQSGRHFQDGGHFLVTLDQASVVVRLQCMSPESLCNLRSQTERLAPAASARSTDPDSSPRSLMAAITPTKGGLGLNTT
ncbi:hypothetical protein CC85DRAFT_20433 [Cutaneotrichosporon oleaginosum]|uniref:Uncharacterized protein n=1 Tax=Cutaneotrichosporon oleaginosum TaxID=879819 RepID=A0A0J0XC87_9TREE|nr:uncharacterized protein CC85DRAFT_20433 [Cutaneotrichosporon oleaginosum]KLT38680.1 hypothetical protein CC85DRAFT_20433 [Cutaneotrichosporon oleaginosum]TXT12273.1 hypothetical protein COLE_02683 [Cutaneotrichosporon oleaginosum]